MTTLAFHKHRAMYRRAIPKWDTSQMALAAVLVSTVSFHRQTGPVFPTAGLSLSNPVAPPPSLSSSNLPALPAVAFYQSLTAAVAGATQFDKCGRKVVLFLREANAHIEGPAAVRGGRRHRAQPASRGGEGVGAGAARAVSGTVRQVCCAHLSRLDGSTAPGRAQLEPFPPLSPPTAPLRFIFFCTPFIATA